MTDDIFEGDTLQQIVDNVPDLIFFSDLEDTFLGANKSFYRSFKLKPRDIVGKKVDQVLSKENYLNIFNQHASSWVTKQDDIEVRRHFSKIIFKDGSVHSVLVKKAPIRIDGNVCGSFVIIADISELTISKKITEAYEKAYISSIDYMIDGFSINKLFFKNDKLFDFEILLTNQAFADLFNLKKDECIGLTFKECDVTINVFGSDFLDCIEDNILDGSSLEILQHVNDSYYRILIYKTIGDYFVMVFTDVTGLIKEIGDIDHVRKMGRVYKKRKPVK